MNRLTPRETAPTETKKLKLVNCKSQIIFEMLPPSEPCVKFLLILVFFNAEIAVNAEVL